MPKLRAFLLAALLAGAALPAGAQSVGITAAVNQSARGTQPNSSVRSIALGDNVIFNERIETDAIGLVQILLADGTTFTVGPNSALVIDSFVYDPNANSAQVAATMTKGVLRFIGGATSKTPDGVAINTPVGTVGIRGGVTDINLSPPEGTPIHIDFLFGNEVTLSSGGAVLGRLFQPGYSLALGSNGQVDVQKTPPEWSSQIQGALAGQPGSNGGAPDQPTDTKVAESGVPDANSQQPLEAIQPPQPMPRLERADEIAAVLVATASEDELRDIVEDLVEEPVDPEEPIYRTRRGGSTGVIEVGGITTPDGDTYEFLGFVPARTTAKTPEGGPRLTEIVVDQDGIPLSGIIDVTIVPGLRLVYEAGREGGVVKFLDDEGAILSADAQGELIANTEATLPEGVDYCTCAFLDWGFWSFTADFHDGEGHTATIAVEDGVWAVGNFTSSSQLNELGLAATADTVASYQGHAIGTAFDFDGQDDSRLVAGDMAMRWSFGTRAGEIAITDFDGRDFAGGIGMNPNGPFFTGVVGSEQGFGEVRGGFVNDGTTPAAGVLGDFLLFEENWSAVGMFMGERGPDLPAQ